MKVKVRSALHQVLLAQIRLIGGWKVYLAILRSVGCEDAIYT